MIVVGGFGQDAVFAIVSQEILKPACGDSGRIEPGLLTGLTVEREERFADLLDLGSVGLNCHARFEQRMAGSHRSLPAFAFHQAHATTTLGAQAVRVTKRRYLHATAVCDVQDGVTRLKVHLSAVDNGFADCGRTHELSLLKIRSP